VRILIYHGKHGDEYFNISTDSLRRGAYRHLFDQLGSVGYYDDPDPDSTELELFNKATIGDDRSVIKFMQVRNDLGYEYERIEELDVPEYEAPTNDFEHDPRTGADMLGGPAYKGEQQRGED